MRRFLSFAGSALLLITAGCSSSHDPQPARGAAEPVAVPYVAMSDARTGLLVWPSAGDWLLLSTTDGFAHVTNRTPPAIDTQGGLSVAMDDGRIAVAVGAHERLDWSPILTAGASWHWQPSEPPGAVSGARGDLAIAGSAVYAVLTGATLITQDGGRWQRVPGPAATDGGATATRLDAVTWHGRDGVLTGHGAAGPAMAWTTQDAGAHWQPVPSTSGKTVAALRPCGAGPHWSIPVVDASGELRLVTSGGASGAAVAVAAGPVALGCAGSEVLVVDRRGHVLESSDDGGHWTDRGAAPGSITSLVPTGAGNGFAASGGGSPKLWRFSGGGSTFSRVLLPGWVATLGGQSGSD